MGYEGRYLYKNDVFNLLNESWHYNHFKYSFDDSDNDIYYTDILKQCDYDISPDHNIQYDFSKDMYFLKQRRSVKFKCKKCDRIIFYKFISDILHLQTATGVDNNGKYLTCDELVIKNIIQ